MNEAMKSRLLEYARELVDQKIAEKQLFAGSNVSVMDKMISLQHGVFARPEEITRYWIRVWAEVTMIQTTTPDAGNSPGGGAVQDGVFTYPPFPVFTLPAENPARQARLDDLEYYLESAEETYPSGNPIYSFSPYRVLDSTAISYWVESQYPPFPSSYPGFSPDSDELNPLRIGEYLLWDTIEPPLGFPPWGTITKTASVTFYVKSHGYETLGDFSLGGAVRLYRITLRQLGRQASSPTPPSVPVAKVLVQEFTADHTGKTLVFSGISTDPYKSLEETVHIIGFEPLTS